MQLSVIQSCQDKVNLGTASVRSTISTRFGVSEAANTRPLSSTRRIGHMPKKVSRLQAYNVFFHADIHEFLSCKYA